VAVAGSLSKSLNWSAWVGTQHDFARILAAIETQFEPLVLPAVEKATARSRRRLTAKQEEITSWRSILADGESEQNSDLEQRFRTLLAEEKASQEQRLQSLLADEGVLQEEIASQREAGHRKFDFRLEVTEPDGGERVYFGRTPEIADLFEGLRFKSFTLAGTRDYLQDHSIKLHASRTFGVTLTVYSTDEMWARAALNHLEEEFKRQVPWWSRLRYGPTLWLIIAGLIGMIIWVVSSLMGGMDTIGTIIWVFFGIVYTSWGTYAFNRFWPVVQVVGAGQRPQGSWLIGGIGSIALAVCVGVFVNWIS
jgi:hypothetical protein